MVWYVSIPVSSSRVAWPNNVLSLWMPKFLSSRQFYLYIMVLKLCCNLNDNLVSFQILICSKLLDRVISVEFAAKDDDVRRNGHSPERGRDRQRDRSLDGRRSPSPYRRERGSPDYGHGSSPYKRQRSSPDYGHGNSRSRSPYRRERGSPVYGRRSISPYRRERDDSVPVHVNSRSPYHKERGRTNRSPSHSLEEGETQKGHGSDLSPEEGERIDPKKGPRFGHSPEEGERIDPRKGHESDHSPYVAVKGSPENGHYQRHSPDTIRNPSPYKDSRGSPRPDAKGNPGPCNDYGGSPNTMPEPRDSPNYGGPESPMHEQRFAYICLLFGVFCLFSPAFFTSV